MSANRKANLKVWAWLMAESCDKKQAYVQVFKTKSRYWIPLIGHPCDHSPIRWQIGEQRTNHHQEFCYRVQINYKVILDDHIFLSSVSTGWVTFGFCQDIFASNLFSSWIALLKLRSQCLYIFWVRDHLLPVDMDTPESTFVIHCSKLVIIFLVNILCFCFSLLSFLFIERSL